MEIPNTAPITTPVVPPNNFTKYKITNIIFHMPDGVNGRVCYELMPYDPLTDELAGGEFITTVESDRLPEILPDVTELQDAYDALEALVEPLNTWIDDNPLEE